MLVRPSGDERGSEAEGRQPGSHFFSLHSSNQTTSTDCRLLSSPSRPLNTRQQRYSAFLATKIERSKNKTRASRAQATQGLSGVFSVADFFLNLLAAEITLASPPMWNGFDLALSFELNDMYA